MAPVRSGGAFKAAAWFWQGTFCLFDCRYGCRCSGKEHAQPDWGHADGIYRSTPRKRAQGLSKPSVDDPIEAETSDQGGCCASNVLVCAAAVTMAVTIFSRQRETTPKNKHNGNQDS